MFLLAATPAEPARSWAHFVAILVALFLFGLFVVYDRVRNANHSPTEGGEDDDDESYLVSDSWDDEDDDGGGVVIEDHGTYRTSRERDNFTPVDPRKRSRWRR